MCCGEGNSTNGQGNQAAWGIDGNCARRRFALVSTAEQAALVDGGLTRIQTVSVVDDQAGSGGHPTAIEEIIGRVTLRGAELETQGINVFGNPDQADKRRTTVRACSLTRCSFLKQFIQRTAAVDGLDDLVDFSLARHQGGITGIRLHFGSHFGIHRQLFAASHQFRCAIGQRQINPPALAGDDDIPFPDRVVHLQATDLAVRTAGKHFALNGGNTGNNESFGHDGYSGGYSEQVQGTGHADGRLLY